jgi:hypothetical protein
MDIRIAEKPVIVDSSERAARRPDPHDSRPRMVAR